MSAENINTEWPCDALPEWDIELSDWDIELPEWDVELPDWDLELPANVQ